MNTPLSSAEVCDAVGITYRQLDAWCREGIIEPANAAKGSGSRRAFNPSEIPYLRFASAVMASVTSCRGAGRASVTTYAAVRNVRLLDALDGIVFVTADGVVSRQFPTGDRAAIAVDLTACAEPWAPPPVTEPLVYPARLARRPATVAV